MSGGKGLPLGTWIQITSDSGCGKTHLVLSIAKAICRSGRKVAYIDSEKGVNDSQLDGIGLTQFLGDKFFVYPISTYEEAEEVMDVVLGDADSSLIVIDSITALIPAKMLEKSVGEIEPGLKARYAGAFIEKYKAKVSMTPNKPTVIMVNQQRVKFSGWMASTGEAGGNEQKFYTDLRLSMKQSKKLEKNTETFEGVEKVNYGVEDEIWCTKNRFNDPFIKYNITILFGKGVSNLAAYKRALMSKGVLKMSGAGFWKMSIPDMEKTCRGDEECAAMIRDNLALVKQYVDDNGGFDVETIAPTEE